MGLVTTSPPPGAKRRAGLLDYVAAVFHDPGCRCRRCLRVTASTAGDSWLLVPSQLEKENGVDAAHLRASRDAARARADAELTLKHDRVGALFPRQAFAGSPQEAAILNLHLREYFAAHRRAQLNTPYAVLPGQMALLEGVGMELPVEGAPTVPHGLHKNLEEAQLRLIAGKLVEGQFGIISVKSAKLGLLPAAKSVQNPVMEARDVSRYPESGLNQSTFAVPDVSVFLLHDVASVVGPHELVERLVVEAPSAHLFVTGVNPPEILERAMSFHPNSHRLTYDEAEGTAHWFPHGSESEGYSQPIAVTESWLTSSSIRASNGVVYQVVLLDYRLGHCLWHVFAAPLPGETRRTFPVGTMMRVPARYTGTLRDEWLHRDFVSKMLSFGERTTVPLQSNYLAKANGLRASNGGFISARDCHIGAHLCRAFDPQRRWWDALVRGLYLAGCFVSLRWDVLFREVPDVYELINERETTLEVRPTEGGGWSAPGAVVSFVGLPNHPTLLGQLSSLTACVSVFLLPKLAAGAALSALWHTDLWTGLTTAWKALDLSAERTALTACVTVIAVALPNPVTRFLARCTQHHYRQLWVWGSVASVFHQAIVEVAGAPGHRLLAGLPGRGWLWQAGLWLTFAHEVAPGFMSGTYTLFGVHSAFAAAPWVAIATHPVAACFWYGFLLSPLAAYALPRLVAHHVPTPRVPTLSPWPEWASGEDVVETCYSVLPDEGWRRVAGAALLVVPTAVTALGAAGALNAWRCVRTCGPNVARRAAVCMVAGLWLASAPSVAASRLPVALQAATTSAVAPPPKHNRTMVVQARLPINGPRGLTYVSTQGMDYRGWLAACDAAYARAPGQYPALAPNASCFFQTVGRLTERPAHQWYSWFQSARNVLPGNCRVPFGETTTGEMVNFCAFAGFGYDIDGEVQLAGHGEAGWPTLWMTLTRNADTTLHCEPRTVAQPQGLVSALAAVLASMRRASAAWANVEYARHARVGNFPRQPSGWLRAVAPGFEAAQFTSVDWEEAWRASFSVRPIIPAQTGYQWDFGQHGPGADPRGPQDLWPTTFIVAEDMLDAPVRGRIPMGKFTFNAPAVMPNRRKRAARPPAGAKEAVRTPEPVKPSLDVVGPVEKPKQAELTEPAGIEAAGRVDEEPIVESAVRLVRAARGVTDDGTRVRGPTLVAPAYSRVHELQALLRADLPELPDELPAVELEEEIIEGWVPDAQRAQRLADDLAEHPELLGPHGSLEIAKMMSVIADHAVRTANVRPVKLTLLLGCSGSGKSTKTREILWRLTADERAAARVVTHTALLRAGTKQTFTADFPEMRGFCFPTMSNILAQPSGGLVVFDDAGKFWGGLLDLVAICNPGVEHMVVNGDPGQGREQIPVPGAMSERLPTMVEQVARVATKYATLSHRQPRLVADTLGLHTTSAVEGFIRHTTEPTGSLIITSSPRYVQVLKGGCRDAVTFMNVQGEEHAEPVELDITGLESAVTDAVAYVGLTRSREGVYIHGEALAPSKRLAAPTGSPLLNAILYDMTLAQSADYRPDDGLARRAFYAHLRRAMPNLVWFAAVGYVPHYTDFQLHTDAAHFDPVEDSRWDEPSVVDAAAALAPPCDVHDVEVAPADKESRERVARGMSTNQFMETAVINAAKHFRTDPATYQMSLDKRLRRATPEENAARQAACSREDMCVMFDIMFPRCPQWADYGEMHLDSAPVEYAEGRTRETVEGKLAAHDPDRTGADVKISLKGQTIKKLEKCGAPAFGGQLIHEYDIGRTLADAPYFRFLEERLVPAAPDNVFFYHRESVPEHVRKMQGQFTAGRGYTGSDVTGWDAGCDAGVLNYDVHVLRRCGMPEDFVAGYEARRLSTRSQHGPMATMQNSGDRGTWIMNSLRRAVLTAIVLRVEPFFAEFSRSAVGKAYVARHCPRYRPDPQAPRECMDINGDDALVDTVKTATPLPDSAWVFKDLTGRSMEFSGMDFRPDGRVSYSPLGLYYRCLVKVETDTTDPIQWAAYADLFGLVDSESALVAEIARLLARYLPVQRVIDCAHDSTRDFVARILCSPEYRAWVHFDNVRRPPPRFHTHR